jgi:hypothetical protein
MNPAMKSMLEAALRTANLACTTAGEAEELAEGARVQATAAVNAARVAAAHASLTANTLKEILEVVNEQNARLQATAEREARHSGLAQAIKEFGIEAGCKGTRPKGMAKARSVLQTALAAVENAGDHNHGNGSLKRGEPCPAEFTDCLVAEARRLLAGGKP